MPEFRKWIIAPAAVILFAGLASAQVGVQGSGPGQGSASGTAFTCNSTNGAVTPTLRSEGFTELTGDIVIICSGGSPLPTATTGVASTFAPIPTANITVFLNTTVTSRLLASSGGASEALLLIDEPGSTLSGYGPGVPQTICAGGTSGLTNDSSVGAGPGGCTEYVGYSNAQNGSNSNGNGGAPVNTLPSSTAGTCISTACPIGANVFQGVSSGNQVVFNGIPVMPPASAGDTRVFRITNIRVNANSVVGGGPVPGSVTASISINSSTSLITNTSTLTVGYVEQGLSATGSNFSKPNGGSSSGVSLAQCTGTSITSSSSQLGLLQFTENFATAFKVRGTTTQNIPGAIFNAESGFTFAPSGLVNTNSGTGLGESAGLADYGTRLKAVFSNVPSGISLYVTTRDIANETTATPVTGYGSTAQAVLVLSETASDSVTNLNSLSLSNTATGIPVASQTTTAPVITSIGLSPVALNPANQTGGVVWEVINTNPNQIDTIDFGVYIAYSANAANNLPTPGTFTVTLSYAPTPSGTTGTTGAFSSSSGDIASSSLTLPRFSDSLDITKTVGTVTLCTTAMLFPYVINVNGFDTGIAIANTSTDPFGTGTSAQNGTCALWFYGGSAPTTNPFVTAPVLTGNIYANLASTIAPGFSGYMIANCNFQFAHGFAFVSDVGARNLAMGYLALIFPSTGRSASPSENLNN
jgi:hypothetical protein